MPNLYNSQIKLLKEIKKITNKFHKNEFNPFYDTPLYFTSYSDGAGLIVLKKLAGQKVNFFKSFFFILKDFLYSGYYDYYKIIESTNTNDCNKIIITWAFKNNFEKNGSLNDKYFNINSRSLKNIKWFVVYLEKDLPKKIDKNIILFQTISKKKINFLSLINFFLINIKYLFKDIKYFLFSISNHSFFSHKFLEVFKNYINKKIKLIVIPYEGQPFQNNLISYLKENTTIKTVGYIHSPPLAFPSNFIKKKFSPSKIVLNGNDQFKCFVNCLGWNKRDIKIKESNRFLNKKTNFSKTIFLPSNINSETIILNSLQFLMKNLNICLRDFAVRNHPVATNSKKNNIMSKKITYLIKNQKVIKNSRYKSLTIFIGASGGIIEALERGYKVIQICEIPTFEAYSNKIWKSIKGKKLTDNIFTYSLVRKGCLIQLGKKPKNLNNFFIN